MIIAKTENAREKIDKFYLHQKVQNFSNMRKCRTLSLSFLIIHNMRNFCISETGDSDLNCFIMNAR